MRHSVPAGIAITTTAMASGRMAGRTKAGERVARGRCSPGSGAIMNWPRGATPERSSKRWRALPAPRGSCPSKCGTSPIGRSTSCTWDGPTVTRMQSLARETGMVLVVPVFELESAGNYYNTAAVIDADGSYLGKYRKHHIPQVKGFWEKYYFKPGNLGWPIFETAVGKIGVYICYDRHFPEGWGALGLAGAQIVFNPSATSRSLSSYLWKLEQPAAAVANEYFVAAINRVGVEEYGDNDFYGTSYFVDPRGQFVGETASSHDEELLVRDLDLGLIDEVRQQWAFYRDRRPDAYGPLGQS